MTKPLNYPLYLQWNLFACYSTSSMIYSELLTGKTGAASASLLFCKKKQRMLLWSPGWLIGWNVTSPLIFGVPGFWDQPCSDQTTGFDLYICSYATQLPPMTTSALFSGSAIAGQSFVTLVPSHGQKSGDTVHFPPWPDRFNPQWTLHMNESWIKQPEPHWHQDRASCKLNGQGRSSMKLDKIAFLDCISQYPLWKNWFITAASVLEKIKSCFIYIYLF